MSCVKNYPRVGSILDFGQAYGDWLLDDDIVVSSTWAVVPASAPLTTPLINSTVIVRNGIEQRIGTVTSTFMAPTVVGEHVLTNTIVTRDGRRERFDYVVSVIP